MFEGNLFHRTLRNANFFDETVSDEELQLHDKLKTIILTNLTKADVFKHVEESASQRHLTMPSKIVLNGPPSLVTALLNNDIKRLPEVQIVKHTARQVVLQTTNERTARVIVQYDGVVLNGLALFIELQSKN